MSEADELYNKLTDYEIATYSSVEPAEEPHIIVGPNGGKDRVIQVPEALKRLGNQYDHDVETVTIECPRYWDGMDMKDMTPYINIMRPDGTKISLMGENKRYFEPVVDTGEDIPTEDLVYTKDYTGRDDRIFIGYDWDYPKNKKNIVAPGTILNQTVKYYEDVSDQGRVYSDRHVEYAVVTGICSDWTEPEETVTIYVDVDGYEIPNYLFRGGSATAIYIKGTGIPTIGSIWSDDMQAFNNLPNLTDIYVHWSEGTVPGAPWGATNATVHYNAFANDEGARTDVPKDKILFDWPIKENITSYAGKLKFIVQLRQTNNEGVVINHWNSDLCTDCYISEGMEWEDYAESAESYDAITQALTIMEDAIEAAEEAVAIKEEIKDIASGLDSSVTDPVGRHDESHKGEIFNDYENNEASGNKASAFGTHTKASGDNQIVAGKYNVEDTENKYVAIIGNGESETDRSNAVTVDWDGNVEVAGGINTSNDISTDSNISADGSITGASINSTGNAVVGGTATVNGGIISQSTISGKKLISTDMSSKSGEVVYVGDNGTLTSKPSVPFDNFIPFSDAEGGRLVNVTTGGKLRAVDPNNQEEIIDIGNKAFKPWLKTRFKIKNYSSNQYQAPTGTCILQGSIGQFTGSEKEIQLSGSIGVFPGFYYMLMGLDFTNDCNWLESWTKDHFKSSLISLGMIYLPSYDDIFIKNIGDLGGISFPLDTGNTNTGDGDHGVLARNARLFFKPYAKYTDEANQGYIQSYSVLYREDYPMNKPGVFIKVYMFPIFKDLYSTD